MKCPRCQQENPPHAKFCLECAAPLAHSCAKCGAELPATAKFCIECAHPVGSPASRVASPESYIPKHLAERILSSKASLEGERKQVTVLFADLKDSMELLADRDPEEARKLLDPVLEHMMEAVHRYEGTVNQVMGDGIMALFGAPLAHEDHAVRACYAALQMQDVVKRYAEEIRRSQGIEPQIRVGVNSGEVVVRSIGSDLHMDYTAVGQTTHLAARMEQLATPGSIRLTADTLRLAEGFIQVRSLGLVDVKGLSEPVEVYEVTGAGAARTRLQAAAVRGLTRFVGREAEIDQLRRALGKAAQGHGQVVAVVGEPGVGKSRLFYEFIHSHRTHDWLVLEGGAVSYGKATPYLPVIDRIRGYFQIEPRDDPRRMREKVNGKLITLDRALMPTLPAFLALLNVPVEDPQWQALDPSQQRQRTLEALKRLLLRESQVQPLCLVFEDLHWIDSETQVFLESLVEGLPSARLLLLLNYRPEYQHPWGSKTYYTQLRIDPLLPESATELLQALLGADAGLEALERFLIERTGGNPFFLEESVRNLVETEVLLGERGAYRLTRPLAGIKVPATVQTILAARIDRLPTEEKRLLQSAAVIGKDVPFTILAAIAEVPPHELRQGLARLQVAEFLYETSLFPEPEYTFKHALTYEVAYGSLLAERRRALHVKIVHAFEALYQDRLSQHVERLAHHTVQGCLWERAVRYLRESGAKAVARSADREATEFFERALEVVANLPETPATIREALDIRIALGPALIALHGSPAPEVATSYRHASQLCDRLGDTSRLFPVLWGLWFTTYGQGRYAMARELAERLLALAESGGDSGQLVEAHHSLWATLGAMGEPQASLVHLRQGLALYDREQHGSQALSYGGHDPGVCCRSHLALTHWLLGYPDQALETLQAAMSLAAQLSHALTTVVTLIYASLIHCLRGEHRSGAEYAEACVALANEMGFGGYLYEGEVLLALARTEQDGNPDRLGAIHQKLIATKIASTVWRAAVYVGLLADACGRMGQPEKGLEVLASLGEEQRQVFYAPEVQRIEGELLVQANVQDHGKAERSFGHAIELARWRGTTSFELRAATSLARLLCGHGRRAEARALLADVYSRFTEGFSTADLRSAKAILEQLA